MAKHARTYGPAEGHSCLSDLGPGTVSEILSQREVRPHKIRYYLEKRDPEFEAKMRQVLRVYRDVQLLREVGGDVPCMVAVLSYDEKPGIQALQSTAPGPLICFLCPENT